MSYRRTKETTIPVPIDIKIEYPAVHSDGQNGFRTSNGQLTLKVNGRNQRYTLYNSGGSEHLRFDADQDVSVNIDVDTDEFDANSARCKENINYLTGSVAATEAAEVASINVNARKIANTIVGGFFKQVKSEVTTKVMEYKQVIESKLMHLGQQANELKKKREQMQTDYHRTASRYTKIFDDLNRELENRVKALDMPVYQAFNKMQEETNRMLNGDFVDVAAVASAENSTLVNQIQSGLIKNHAQAAIGSAQNFLYTQRCTEATIKKSIVHVQEEGDYYYIPVCYCESVQSNGSTSAQLYYDKEHINDVSAKKLTDDFVNDSKLCGLNDAHRELLSPYINSEMAQVYSKVSSKHADRVKEAIIKLFNA